MPRSTDLSISEFVGYAHLEKTARLLVRDWPRITNEKDFMLLDHYIHSLNMALTCIDRGC